MLQTFIFPGDVPTKKNKYVIGENRLGGKMLYKPKTVTSFEKLVAQVIMVQRGKRIEGPMKMSLTLVHSAKAEPDLDGTITTVLDAMQDAGLFDNDKEIKQILACEKRQTTGPKDLPRVEVTIGKIK